MNTLEVCAQYLGCKKCDHHSFTPITLHKTTCFQIKKMCILYFRFYLHDFKIQKITNITCAKKCGHLRKPNYELVGLIC